MIAPLPPLRTKMNAEPTSPTRPRHAPPSRSQRMNLFPTPHLGAGRASVGLGVVFRQVFGEEIDVVAEVAGEHLGALLVGFFVSLPVCF